MLFRSPFERAVVLTASAIEWLCDHNHEVELRTASGMVGFGTGNTHLTRCRRALARLKMVDPSEGDAFLLHNPEPGIVRFPILLKGHEGSKEGRVPLSVDEFREGLDEAFRPPAEMQETHVVPRMF